ncbi:MAG: class I SAM-dependent RNA methyltransferase [Nitrospirae bacterium]|nr:MAG: class I SAM-dependent RNA methyltransferase [Nitrospirota bacterium]
MILEALEPIYGGYTLARQDGVVFIEGAIPGEVVETEVIQKRKDYSVAVVKNIIRASEDRVVPRCEVFRLCGGCHYQHISYEKQLRIKEDVLRNTIKRIGKIDVSLDASIASEPYNYRLRAQVKVSSDGRIGFYRPASHEIVEFSRCHLLDTRLNDVINLLRQAGLPPEVAEIHLSVGDVVLARVKTRGPVDGPGLFEKLQASGISGAYIEGAGLFGLERLCLDLNGFFYFLSAGAFFQSNWALNKRIVSVVCDILKALRPDRVVDLYAGAGNFSLPGSRYTEEVIAVETSEQAVLDGLYSCQFNSIENVRFLSKAVEQCTEIKKAPFVIVDPPRVGLTKKARQKVLALRPEWVVYVSCNPSTLARDLAYFVEEYEIESLRLVDMFAQTYHIEGLCMLKRKQKN